MPNCEKFQWDELLTRIKRKNVIPIISQELYRVEIENEEKKDILLYDYLANRIVEEYKLQPPQVANHKFAVAALEFLKNKPKAYIELSEFLLKSIEGARLTRFNPLWKLSRIKAFEMFITTAYDDFLENTLKKIRGSNVKKVSYGGVEKKREQPLNDLFDFKNNPRYSLVYHILGDMKENSFPAYTETDILETVLEFKRDIEAENQNRLFWKLQSSSLLFLGSCLDDWLYRFFIRILGNQVFQFSQAKQVLEFVGGNFCNKKDPFFELPLFLEKHNLEVFSCTGSRDFVDLLYEKLERNCPEEIISFEDIPPAFISFEGADREAARNLAANLRRDGINVWLDEREFIAGDEIDETIIKAIDKSTAFIPLISRNSMKIQKGKEKLKYHIREWERAYTNMISGDRNVKIVPVKIDDTDWLYEKFKGLFFLTISGINSSGGYEKLKNVLLDIQQPTR